MVSGASYLGGLRLNCNIKTLILVLSLCSSACGQVLQKPVSKEQALKGVKVSDISGWKEASSSLGRFRILFPGEPTLVENGDDVAGLQGFKLLTPEKNWFAYRYNYTESKSVDGSQLRAAYRQSVEAITRRPGTKLLSQNDVMLNGWLGTELVIESQNAVSYMRAFQTQHCIFTLSVDVKKTGEVKSVVPQDVQHFFDSFTYWE
jgi:hypothetical protein